VIDLLGGILERHRGERCAADLVYSLNISAVSLKTDGFGLMVVARLQAAGLAPHEVLIELTESAMMAVSPAEKANIAAFLAAGYELSIDDFGTGFSSLSHLHQLQLREVKVDRSFTARIGADIKPSDTVVRAILAMARALGLRTVAEGVETEEQLAWFQLHGCEQVQGFHFAPALEEGEFFGMLT